MKYIVAFIFSFMVFGGCVTTTSVGIDPACAIKMQEERRGLEGDNDFLKECVIKLMQENQCLKDYIKELKWKNYREF